MTNKEEALGPILIAAAERLTYRGYDSVGVAALNGSKIDLRKDVGKVEEVAAKYNFAKLREQRGITQLRWATFGEPSQVNAQPHIDLDGDLVGAHNGNVVNNVELRERFIAEDDSRLRANADDLIVIPKSDAQIAALLGVLPLQLLSYHMSVMRGFDPDFPRNLSKTLTVD